MILAGVSMGEALRRGLNSAERIVVLGDGAKWIKGIADMHFPNAIQIVDLYHAREHVCNLCKILFAMMKKVVFAIGLSGGHIWTGEWLKRL